MSDLAKRFEDIDLYPVTCAELSCGRSALEVVRALAAGGAKIVQYREKNKPVCERLKEAEQLRQVTYDAGMLFIVNDDLALCQAVEADGVHLGQDDFPCAKARLILGDYKIIGVSTHSLSQAQQAAQEGATYANVGPIFATATKAVAVDPVGLDLFKQILECVALPLTVMGGIHLENLEMVLQAGAKRIAMVSEVVSHPYIEEHVRLIRSLILSSR